MHSRIKLPSQTPLSWMRNNCFFSPQDEQGTLVADLDLSKNYVGNKTIAFVLADVVPRLPHLERLNLRSCQVTNSEVSLLCKTAAKHPALAEIDLSGNPDVYLEGAMNLRRLRQQNPNIKVELEHTGVSEAMVKVCAEI